MIAPIVWLLIALFAANAAFLASVAISPEARAWYRVHYRWYAAFAVLTAGVVMVISLRQIIGG